MRKLQIAASHPPRYTIACLGDSYTYNTSLGVTADGFYPYQTQAQLNAAGASIKARNYGISGDTTAGLLFRMAQSIQFEIPDIAVIYQGTNDSNGFSTTVASSSSQSVFTVQTGAGAAYKAGGYVIVNGTLTSGQVTGGTSGQILSVVGDVITLTAPIGFTITNGMNVGMDTQNNLIAIGNFLKNAGCTRLIYGLLHYLNFSSGGDTTSTPIAARAVIRTMQTNAATAVGGVVADYYTYMKNLIVNATHVTINGVTYVFVQGDHQWHVLDLNPHPNSIGGVILATVNNNAIQAQSGWLAAIST